MKERRSNVYQMIYATMPSTRFLVHSLLEERIVSEGDMLLLAFDLVETPQLQLFSAPSQRRENRFASKLREMLSELVRLKEEAETTVIRVAELTRFAAMLSEERASEFEGAVGQLSEQDAELWQLIIARRSKAISIRFADVVMDISLPLVYDYHLDHAVRKISFNVITPGRKAVEVEKVAELTAAADSGTPRVNFPRRMPLLRSRAPASSACDFWFLLYVAEFTSTPVEATVRVAIRTKDFTPRHLELVSIDNQDALQARLHTLGFSEAVFAV